MGKFSRSAESEQMIQGLIEQVSRVNRHRYDSDEVRFFDSIAERIDMMQMNADQVWNSRSEFFLVALLKSKYAEMFEYEKSVSFYELTTQKWFKKLLENAEVLDPDSTERIVFIFNECIARAAMKGDIDELCYEVLKFIPYTAIGGLSLAGSFFFFRNGDCSLLTICHVEHFIQVMLLYIERLIRDGETSLAHRFSLGIVEFIVNDFIILSNKDSYVRYLDRLTAFLPSLQLQMLIRYYKSVMLLHIRHYKEGRGYDLSESSLTEMVDGFFEVVECLQFRHSEGGISAELQTFAVQKLTSALVELAGYPLDDIDYKKKRKRTRGMLFTKLFLSRLLESSIEIDDETKQRLRSISKKMQVRI